MMDMESYCAGMRLGARPTASVPPPLHSLEKPAPLARRYQIEAPLGHDAGSVFRARDRKTGTRHAIKWLPREAALQPGEYERLVSELTQLWQLCHPNIVAMTALHREPSGRLALIMELLEGQDALTHLAGGRSLPWPRVLEITRQVASALHSAHLCGIAHRDFQLSSIFLAVHRGFSGEQVEVVKVVGFGAVKVPRLPGQLAEDGVLGTPEYLAPEGMPGRRSELDASSDQWAVAVAVYRMLSGRLPFAANDEADLQSQICTRPPLPLGKLCPELPPHVIKSLLRALSKDKAQRFASMLDFMRALSGQTPGDTSPSQPSHSVVPGPISLSECPTIPVRLDLERTQMMESAVLAKLCAASQVSERRQIQPVLLAPRSARRNTLGARWHKMLAIILGACIGVGLGTGTTLRLVHHVMNPSPSALSIPPTELPFGTPSLPEIGSPNSIGSVCVSTQKPAIEGVSLDAQSEKLRLY